MVKRKPKGVEPQSDSNDEWPPAWYREYLVKALQDGDAQYERLVTTLTAAALGGSFALVRVQTATDPHYGIWGVLPRFLLVCVVDFALGRDLLDSCKSKGLATKL